MVIIYCIWKYSKAPAGKIHKSPKVDVAAVRDVVCLVFNRENCGKAAFIKSIFVYFRCKLGTTEDKQRVFFQVNTIRVVTWQLLVLPQVCVAVASNLWKTSVNEGQEEACPRVPASILSPPAKWRWQERDGGYRG